MEKQENENMELLLERQRKREERLAKIMLDRLALYANSKEDPVSQDTLYTFQQQIASECDKSRFMGIPILHCVGSVYSCKAKAYLGISGGDWPWIYHAMVEKVSIMHDLWKAVSQATETKSTADRLNKMKQDQVLTAEQREWLEDAACAQVMLCIFKTFHIHNSYPSHYRLMMHYGDHAYLKSEVRCVVYVIWCYMTK